MPYQGSTQSVGFRNRAVPDSASRKAQSLAQALDKQRVESVNQMEKVSRDQLSEMARQDKQLSSNDAYELQNLKEFSKTLDSFLKTSAQTVGKAYIDTQRQKGIDLARACHNGDKSACASVSLDEQQVSEINAKVEEMRKNSTGAADNIELQAELKKYKLSLEEKATALNIRKLGANIGYGYRQQELIERSKNFKPWLLSAVKPEYDANEQRIDDTITVTNELNEEIQVRVGDFDQQSPEVQKKIIGYLERKYLEENDGGFNRNVVNTYLTKEVVKVSEKFKEDTLNRAIKTQAAEEKDLLQTELKTAFQNLKSDDPITVENAKASIQKALHNLTSIERRLGTDGSPNVAAKKALLTMIVGSGSYLNMDDMEGVLDLLEDTEFEIPGHGQKNLTKFWSDDFDIRDIRASMLKTQDARIRAEDNNLNLQTKVAITEAKAAYRDTGDKEAYLSTIKGLLDTDLEGGTQFASLYAQALEWKVDLVPETQALKDAAYLDEKYKGEIPLKYTTKWPKNVVDKYKDKIIGPGEGIADTDLAATNLASAHAEIDTEVKRIGQVINKSDRSAYNLDYGIQKIQASIPGLVKKLRAEGFEGSNAEAITIVKGQIIAGLQADNGGQGGTGLYEIDVRTGTFREQAFQPSVQVVGSLKQITKDNLNTARNRISSYDGDIFQDKEQLLVPITSPLLNQVGYSEPGKANTVGQFWKHIANEDPLERTPFEIINLEREKHGLEPIEWDDKTQNQINNYKGQPPEIRKLLRSGLTTLQERGIDLAGGISSKHIHAALLGPNGESFVSQAEFSQLASDAGLPDMSWAEYQANPEAIEKLQRYKVNRLIPLALSLTPNKLIAIRMIAAAKDVPLNEAEASMQNWNGLKSGDDLDKNTASILNSYISGNTDNIKHIDTTRRFTEATLTDVEGNIDYETVGEQVIPNSTSAIDAQITELEANKPQEFKPTTPFHYPEKTKEWIAYQSKLEKLNSHRKVFELIDRSKSSPRFWTAASSSQSIKNVIGKDRYQALVKEAGGPLSPWHSQDKWEVWHTKFETLLRAQPEFRGGNE